MLKHKIDNIKRMAAHPSQPLCKFIVFKLFNNRFHLKSYCKFLIFLSRCAGKRLFNFLFIDLTGGADGSVQLWEWGLPSCVWSPRAPGAFAKVTRVRFSDYGNKFAASDADGNLAMWQLHPVPNQPGHSHASPRPFFVSLYSNCNQIF